MSKLEIIDLHLHPKHLLKLSQGGNIQLTYDELHSAIVNKANTELHMLRPHVTQLINAHKKRAGIRLTQNKIVGGKLGFD